MSSSGVEHSRIASGWSLDRSSSPQQTASSHDSLCWVQVKCGRDECVRMDRVWYEVESFSPSFLDAFRWKSQLVCRRSLSLLCGPNTNMQKLHKVMMSAERDAKDVRTAIILYNSEGCEVPVSIQAKQVKEGDIVVGLKIWITLSDPIPRKMATADDGRAKALIGISAPYIISDVTPQFCKRFTFTESQALDKPLLKLLAGPNTDSTELKNMIKVALGGVSQHKTHTLYNSACESSVQKVSVVPVMSKSGEITNLSVFCFPENSSIADAEISIHATPTVESSTPPYMSNAASNRSSDDDDMEEGNPVYVLLQQACALSQKGSMPRAMVTFMLDGHSQSSAVAPESRTPLWNQIFVFKPRKSQCTINVRVDDWDKLEGESFIGCTNLLLCEELENSFVDSWFVLQGVNASGKIRLACSKDKSVVEAIAKGLQPFGKSKLMQPYSLAPQDRPHVPHKSSITRELEEEAEMTLSVVELASTMLYSHRNGTDGEVRKDLFSMGRLKAESRTSSMRSSASTPSNPSSRLCSPTHDSSPGRGCIKSASSGFAQSFEAPSTSS